jgi:hypothetical protein
MSYSQLMAEAEAQAQSETQGQNAPLIAQEQTLGSQQQGASNQIGSMFDQLMPYVQGSAQQVQQAKNDSLALEQSIFQAAGQRMNQLKQQQAEEAQQLAQQIGGPVATGEFTAALSPYESQMPAQAAANMMHGLGLAQADTEEAQQFAGQVFPALRTEQQAKSNSFFQDQIKTLQNQITQNEAGKSALTNSKLTDLLNNERSFRLNVAQAAEAKLKDKHDWQATQAQLHADDVRLGLSKQAAQLSKAGVTGKFQGKPTIQAIHLDQEQKLAAQRMGISAAEFQARLQHSTESTKLQQQRLGIQQTKAGMTALDAAYDPTNGKPVTMTTKTYIPKGSLAEVRAISGKTTNAHYDPQKKQYYQYERLTLTAKQWAQRRGYTGTKPVTDPNQLFHLVRSEVPGLSRTAVIRMVRAKTGQENWSPSGKG